VGSWDRISGLPLLVEAYALEGLEARPTPEFVRRTTVVHLRGGGEEGLGEDVTYDAGSQLAQQQRGPILPLAGEHSLGSFSALLEGFEFEAPKHEIDHRRWGYESAALDLALRQAGLSIARALDREPKPVRYVVSKGLGSPPSPDPLRRLLEHYPNARFKLDASSSWTAELIDELAKLRRTDVVDFKGVYRGDFGEPPDAELYRAVADAFTDAWLEDPALTPETERALAAGRERITWDAPVHSVADVDALPFAPRALNVKPSRFGTVERLLDFYDHCEANRISLYGGGQFELGVGRGQIQLLASLYHPDEPNDVAPAGFNQPEPGPDLEPTPLDPVPERMGFRRARRRSRTGPAGLETFAS
jgi:L-alanine-DL-glutamate epimerase-like enolase superfamily enzyme